MKGPMFCFSQASTAICSSMDNIQKSTTINDSEDCSSRAIDRHNPIIKEGRRSLAEDFIKLEEEGENSNKKVEIYKGRRSITGGRKSTGSTLLKIITNDISLARKSFSCVARPVPVGSTRFLLGSDPGSIPGSKGQEPGKIVDVPSPPSEDKISGGGCGSEQVVVLKVSLHCRGCEAKVRKHLAKMQGVTSFNIDYVAKKVTVTGDITPLEILDSISKVKNAQFWTTPSIPNPNVQTLNP